MSQIWPYIQALIPSAGLLYLGYVVVKSMVEGDRRERLAQEQWEKEKQERE